MKPGHGPGRHRRALLSLAAALAGGSALAQTGAPPTSPDSQGLRLSPVLVQSSHNGGSALGLDYAWTRRGRLESGAGSSRQFPPGLDGVVLDGLVWELDARGHLSGGSSSPSQGLQTADATVAYELRSLPVFARLGLTARLEAVQDLGKRRSQWGLSGLLARSGALNPGDLISLRMLYGSAQPDKDPDRKAVLGALRRHERWNLETSYKLPVMRATEASDDPVWRKLRHLELGYRHGQEIKPASALVQAGLHRQRLGYVRLNFEGDHFLQYASGRHPLDTQGQRSVQIGWDLKFD